MTKTIGSFLLLPLLAAAQTTRVDSDQISDNIRLQLEMRGIRIGELTRLSEERRSAPRVSEGGAMQVHATGNGNALDPAMVKLVADTFSRLYGIYNQLNVLNSPPDLYINTDAVINAYASKGQEVHIFAALPELIHDSQSELAFAIAHEMGHIVQQRSQSLLFVPDNPEFDADVWGVLIGLLAGYDPYAGAGTLAKLSMATGDVGLQQQFEDQSSQDAHKSFVSRIEIMYGALKGVCGINADFTSLCNQYRSQVHPHFPSNAVL
jgi:predicted Zn-dependent protease